MAESIDVLHVEDDPEFASLTAEVLERENDQFDVVHVQSTSDGLDRLEDGDFDCLLSDYEMPDRNGIEFLETVRTAHPDLPFILFTGKGSEEVASDAIHAGVTDYLQKERGVDQFAILANRIENAVDGYHSRRTLAERDQEMRIYERIFNTMHGGACLYDREGRFQIVNDYIVDFYGTSRDALEGQQSTLVAHIRGEADGDPYQELLDGERSHLQGVVEMEDPDGEPVFTEYRFTPLSIDGTVEGVVAVARDLTERKERERRLEEFVSVASHDLRNPLDVARGRLELAREECASDHLDDVARAHARMVELIEDLLTLAREGGHIQDLEAVDLGPLVEGCWRNVDTAEATREIAVDRTIRADRSRLQQLVENLVRNAIEHAGDDVTVRVGSVGDGFYVEDDGPGISPDERDGLFDVGSTSPGGGTGLGISIVEQIVDEHGWSIDVTDGTGGGARFAITNVEFVERD